MWEMTVTTTKAFFSGTLFADNGKAFRSMALGLAIASALFLLARALRLPAWGAAAGAGFLGGVLQPWLLRNVKYR
jgi:hypothetical protein